MQRKIIVAYTGICFLLTMALLFGPNIWLGNEPNQTNVENAQVLFDKDGVPILRIEGVGDVRHPGWIALYALAYAGVEKYDDNMGVDESPAKFKACIKWLEGNLVQNQKGDYVWEYPFDNTYNDVSIAAPWSSAFGQAVGIQALVAAYKADGDNSHLALAEKAAQVLFRPLSDQGLLFVKSNDIWFEEIPSSVSNPSHILNGHMRTLLALQELAQATGNPLYQTWFSLGLVTLERWLPLYDNGYALRYDLNPKKSELLFRFNNPYGYPLSELAVDKIIMRDPLSNKETALDVGEATDASGALRIAGNDWGQQQQLDGRSIRRLKPVVPASAQDEATGDMKSPSTYFYLTLPGEWADNLRTGQYELEIFYKDEAPGNITVQMQSIAPGQAFRDLRDGDLLLTGSGQWKSWKVPLRTSDLGWWVGNTYSNKHALYLNKLSGESNNLAQWSKIAQGYKNFNTPHDINPVQLEPLTLPAQTPMLPVYSFDENGVVMQHKGTANTKWKVNGMFDPSGDYGVPVYQFYVISSQLLDGDQLAGGAFPYANFKMSEVKRKPALIWLMNTGNFSLINDAAIYYYDFPNAYNDIYTPTHWQSAFGQAYVLKGLKYAYDHGIGNKDQVKRQLERSARAYEMNVKAGGLVTFNLEGQSWAEEVPNGTHVLNAHLISTEALTEIEKTVSNSDAHNTRLNFLSALKDNLFRFDTGYWSRYDQNPKKEMLFQIDWLQGEQSPLIDSISLENPQTTDTCQIDVGSDVDFTGYPNLAGVDWQTDQVVDGKSVRSFSNGYNERSGAISGGARHNVFFLAALPDRQFDNLFAIAAHQLVIKYKDVAPGEFNIKVQSINNGNNLEFIPLRGGILRCTGDGQWKEAAFTVRPQDMGWYMGEDYQLYHVNQIRQLAEQNGDWFLAQYAEKWQYYLNQLKAGQPVIVIESAADHDAALNATVTEPFSTYPGFELNNALDGDPDDDYVAGIENQLPASFTISLKKETSVQAIDLLWESETNYGIDYSIDAVGPDGQLTAIGDFTGQAGKEQKIILPNKIETSAVRIIVKRTAGQNRVLLRQIRIMGS